MTHINNTKRGFTLVELLIVIVVIAILAAISIVAFNGVQQRGRDSARQSDVSNIVKALTAYTADDGTWPIDAAAAETALSGYETANLSEEITDRLSATAPNGDSTENRNRYQYVRLCTGAGNTTGAEIVWWNEQRGETDSSTAGTGSTTCA